MATRADGTLGSGRAVSTFILSCSIMFTPVVLFVQIFPHVRELFVLDDALFSGLSYSIFPKRHQMGDAFQFFPSLFLFPTLSYGSVTSDVTDGSKRD